MARLSIFHGQLASHFLGMTSQISKVVTSAGVFFFSRLVCRSAPRTVQKNKPPLQLFAGEKHHLGYYHTWKSKSIDGTANSPAGQETWEGLFTAVVCSESVCRPILLVHWYIFIHTDANQNRTRNYCDGRHGFKTQNGNECGTEEKVGVSILPRLLKKKTGKIA